MSFDHLDIMAPIRRALKHQGYRKATPIQADSIPHLLDGRDLLGCAQTGTGKTAAFAIPILQKMASESQTRKGKRPIRALVLAPTRELAIQIGDSFSTYGSHLDLRVLTIYGGVTQHPQTKELGRGVDILVATPGRLLDLVGQKFVDLSQVEFFVLDEADRMLDMGMIRDVKKIIERIPEVRQTMFFSATMPQEIASLSDSILKDPVRIEVTPVASTVETIEQMVYHVDKKKKIELLVHLLQDPAITSALVFSRTKHGADKIVRLLHRAGVQAQAIHGNKSQNARQRALKDFKERRTRVLVATDIAARGIDVEELSHVFNYDLPEIPETYVHRIGRTGRAGLGGVAISFCNQEEKPLLRDIQKLIGRQVPLVNEHPYPLMETDIPAKTAVTGRQPKGRQSSGSGKDEKRRGVKNGERRGSGKPEHKRPHRRKKTGGQNSQNTGNRQEA